MANIRLWGWTILLLSSGLSADPAVRTDAALPNLGVAKRQVREYYAGGAYKADVQRVTTAAQKYLEENLSRFVQARPAIVLDVDETAVSNLDYFLRYDLSFLPNEFNAFIGLGESPAIPEVLDIYRYCRSRNVPVFFISGRLEKQREATDRNLKKAGYLDWQELILRPEGQTDPSTLFKAAQRRRLVSQGYSIVLNMGDQESDLAGGYAEAQFKLPNPIYWIP